MGCQMAHSLLNFVEAHRDQEWIDKYIQTYFPVGAAHLVAPKSMRGTVIGDKMGPDAFLSEEEALITARSFGTSVPRMLGCTLFLFLPEYRQLKNGSYSNT
jgi:hypothetical protein